MAELAASVGHQLIHVDYDNNKHDYINDNNVYSSSVRHIHHDVDGTGPSPGCLLDLGPDDFQSPECPPSVRLSVAAVDTPQSAGMDSTQVTAMTCDATSNNSCTRCGIQPHHHHHHHEHRQPPHQQSLVYGQFCADGTFSDDRYPVGLRTPQ